MLDDIKISLIKYRIEQSQDCLDSAVRDFEADSYMPATNRSYYCIFHAMRAVLAIDGFDSKKHSGIISAFQQKYIILTSENICNFSLVFLPSCVTAKP